MHVFTDTCMHTHTHTHSPIPRFEVQRMFWHSKLGNLILLPASSPADVSTADWEVKANFYRCAQQIEQWRCGCVQQRHTARSTLNDGCVQQRHAARSSLDACILTVHIAFVCSRQTTVRNSLDACNLIMCSRGILHAAVWMRAF